MTFEQWFTATYGELYKDYILQEALKEIAFNAWQAAQPQWQPIETAPKNGEMILVCLPRQMNLILRARWSEIYNMWLADKEFENCLDRGIFFHHGDLWTSIPQPLEQKP